MNWQTIFNPFSKFSERTLLIGGLLITILGTIIGYYCNASFNGVLNMQISTNAQQTTLSKTTVENIINILTISIVLFITGKILNAKTRIIDIINTALWYRLPLYICSIFGLILIPKKINKNFLKNIKKPEQIFENEANIILILVFGIIILLLLAYCITLLTNGFKTATNIKRGQHFVVFAFSILIAEILSVIILLKIT